MAAFSINFSNHVGSEVNDLLEILRCKVKKITETTWNALEVPDMCYGCCKLDVTHSLTADFGTSNFNTASFANNSLEANSLVLAAVALPVTSRTEDLLVEETILLWLERAVVNCLWLLDFTV